MRKRIEDSSSNTWDDFWTAFQSALQAQHHATRSHSAQLGTFTTSRRSNKASTVVVTVPQATVTVQTTIYSTDLVTVSATARSLTATSVSSTTETISTPARTLQTVLPSVVTETVLTSLPSIATVSPSASATGPANATISADTSQSGTQKRDIVGGLSGTIAGLVVIGLLICLILRVRRRRRGIESPESFDSLSEKGSMPSSVRPWTAVAGDIGNGGSPDQPSELSRRVSPDSVDEDHRMINMDTQHWSRPYAPGKGEGWRESTPPGQLHVVNPDFSRPVTPRRPSEMTVDSLKKQRSGFAGFVFGRVMSYEARSPAPSLAQSERPKVPEKDPAPKRKSIVSWARTPSFRSYPSRSSFPAAVQQTPKEHTARTTTASYTPSEHFEHQTPHQLAETPPSTPNKAQLAAGTAGRTPPQLNHYRLYPAPLKTSTPNLLAQNKGGITHFSYSTNASMKSRRSDPFDLDIASMRTIRPLGSPTTIKVQRSIKSPRLNLYEGT